MRRLKSQKPVIIAMVGLIGSGKSSVARELAKHLNAKLIEGDAIHIQLRKEKINFRKARNIAVALVEEYVRVGKSVVIDSDFVDAKKRNALEKKARVFGARVVYVRVCAEPDVAIGRMMSALYSKSADDFFGGAVSTWKGKQSGAVVKIREFWRRTPHHYWWNNTSGGVWVLRKFPFVNFMIDTTNGKTWKKRALKIARKLKM